MLRFRSGMGAIALVVTSSIGAALVAAVTLLSAGTDAPGALLAARNTARFSSVVFALALLVSSVDRSRFPSLAARRVALWWSFVAAHLVHYAMVVFQIFVNPQARRHLLELPGIVVAALGFSLVLVIGFTAAARTRAQAVWNRIATWTAAVSFLLALGTGASRGHRIDVALTAAMALAAGASALLLRGRGSAAASPGIAP